MPEDKSTNVRTDTRRPAGPFWAGARLVSRAVQWVAPEIAARVATHLFVKGPPRHPETGVRPLATPTRLTLAVRGRDLAAWSWGDERAPAVILVHGWGGRATQLLGFVDPLVATGARVIAFDAPGHGESPGTTTNIPEIAEAIEAAAALASSVSAVIGHSMGGAATVYALAGGLPARRAAIIGAPADALQWLTQLARTLDLRGGTLAETRHRIEASVGVPFEALDAATLGPAIRAPLLVVHDRGDRNVPFADAERWSSLVRTAGLLATEGLGHQRILRDGPTIARTISFVTATDLPARARSRSPHLDEVADRVVTALDAA